MKIKEKLFKRKKEIEQIFLNRGFFKGKKERVLEMASILKEPKSFIKEKKEDKDMEKARFYSYQYEMISELITNDSITEKYGWPEILLIDFENGLVKVRFYDFDKDEYINAVININPKVKITKASKKEDSNVSEKETKKEEVKVDEVVVEEKKECVKECVKAEETKEDSKLVDEIAELKTKLEEAEVKLKEEVAKAKETTKVIIERRNSLGEFAKDISDEDILDDKEFQIASLKKENNELKSKKLEKSSLEVGSEEEKTDEVKKEVENASKIDPVYETQARIREKAFKIN